MTNRYFGYLMIVAGVFVVLAGGCFFVVGLMFMSNPDLYTFVALAVGIFLIVVGVKSVRATSRRLKDDEK